MRILSFLFLFLVSVFCCGFSTTEDISQSKIENILGGKLKEHIVFTEVPRGLIISIDENVLFDSCNTKIKKESLYVLDEIANLLKKLKNICVIENHTQDRCTTDIKSWETSMMRSGNIAEYLTKYKEIPHEQIFDIGYGEFMPFNETVNPKANELSNRVDFVIISYDAIR